MTSRDVSNAAFTCSRNYRKYEFPSALETSFVLRGGKGEGAEEERLQKSKRYATEGGREGVRPPRKFNP
ncbi:hypothetical protein DPX16_17716 [Anabarilius grahami]|uniref:Uncharacterized protein n=1 Tax=Anabarilius grahami TaxID=495550 RepID=A0A3N0YI93_ANAGA|nr:hypothetical protein DPX16_17716 [Anabarilius grahami]